MVNLERGKDTFQFWGSTWLEKKDRYLDRG